MAGLSVGFLSSPEEVRELQRVERRFEPEMADSDREELLRGWRRALHAASAWAHGPDE